MLRYECRDHRALILSWCFYTTVSAPKLYSIPVTPNTERNSLRQFPVNCAEWLDRQVTTGNYIDRDWPRQVVRIHQSHLACVDMLKPHQLRVVPAQLVDNGVVAPIQLPPRDSACGLSDGPKKRIHGTVETAPQADRRLSSADMRHSNINDSASAQHK